MRRAVLALLALLLAAPALAQLALAQPVYPDRPIRLVIAFGPGGGADTTARLMAGPMGAFLGQSVLVENRSGGGGTQAGGVVAQAAPDGHVLLLDASAYALRHRLSVGLGFDYLRDLAPVARLTDMPLLLVVPPDEPAENLAAYIAALRRRPAPLLYAVAATGSASHFAGLLLLQRSGLVGEPIAYRGGSPAAIAVVTRETLLNFATTPSAVALVQGGRLRALAVSSAERMRVLPEVPTVAEAALPGFALTEWIAMYAPARTPAPVLARVHAALAHALAQPEVVARLADVGAVPALLVGEEFATFLAAQRSLLAGLAEAAGLRAE